MDRKIELQVLNITNSQEQVGAFAMLLGEVGGERRLPIIIGAAEAQATALHLKGFHTPRPLTHDLFATTLAVMGASLIQVLIYKAKDGIFYSHLYLKREEEITRIDARTSDAIALAVRASCPILIYESLLEQERLHLPDEESVERTVAAAEGDASLLQETLGSLEEQLEEAIREENYELAARLRDRIREKKQ